MLLVSIHILAATFKTTCQPIVCRFQVENGRKAAFDYTQQSTVCLSSLYIQGTSHTATLQCTRSCILILRLPCPFTGVASVTPSTMGFLFTSLACIYGERTDSIKQTTSRSCQLVMCGIFYFPATRCSSVQNQNSQSLVECSGLNLLSRANFIFD